MSSENLSFEEVTTGHAPDPQTASMDNFLSKMRKLPKSAQDQILTGLVGAGAEIPASVLDAHTAKREDQAANSWSRAVAVELDKLRIRHEAQQLFDAEQRAESPVGDGWTHVDISRLSGDVATPTVCRRSDGALLFYQGKVNVVFGDSESGKSWLCLLACAQELAAGGAVTYMDYEDDPNGIVSRLLALGVPRAVLDDPERFLYFRLHRGLTDEAFDWYAEPATWETSEGIVSRTGFAECSLVVIDAMTEALSADGLSSNSDVDIAGWFNTFARRIAALGPAVAVIDHMNLTDKSRQGGSQMKKSATDGVSIAVKKGRDFAPGVAGYSYLSVAKDRHGGVKARAEGKDLGRFVMPELAEFAHILPPDPEVTPEAKAAATEYHLREYVRGYAERGGALTVRAVATAYRDSGHQATQELIADVVREHKEAQTAAVTEPPALA